MIAARTDGGTYHWEWSDKRPNWVQLVYEYTGGRRVVTLGSIKAMEMAYGSSAAELIRAEADINTKAGK